MSRREFLEKWATMDVDTMEEATVMWANTVKGNPTTTETNDGNEMERSA